MNAHPNTTSVLRICADRRFPERPLQSLWQARELLLLLTKREVHLRYQHSTAGIGWAILQPVLTVAVLVVFQSFIGHNDGSTLPYPLYATTALVPWTFMVHAMTQSSNCILNHSGVIGKVQFPRMVLPLAAVLGATVDFLLGLILVPALMICYGVRAHLTILALPLFTFHLAVFAAALGIWFAYLNARFRDTSNALPFITQLWFFLSPIVYTTNMVPERWQFVLGLNPMVGILEGFRWTFFGSANPLLTVWVMKSWLITCVLLVTGIGVFLANEESLADII